jgi:type II secretory pathway component GspD/PulD (secretin)
LPEGEEVPSERTIRIPLSGSPPAEAVRISGTGDSVTLVVRDAPLRDVLSMLAESRNLNIDFNDSLTERVSITLNDRPLGDVLTSILAVAGYRWSESRGIIHVMRVDQADLPAEVQGRHLQVFELDYTAAADVLEAVQGFLSPAGKAFVLKSNTADNLRTRESLVVEDLPDVIARVTQYVAQIDQPPRQVLIQVHVLQVELKDELRHGVNLEALLKIGNIDLNFQTVGFANPDAATASFITLTGPDLTSLIECLQTTTDAKTIASPRVLCLNGQESRIQVGEQLGFRVTTTTETSTLQSVEFLDVGVVVRVTPRISRDNQVMINIKPEVSSGRVNPVTGLPEEETTEVNTNVLLASGQAIVIGGLIKETLSDNQSKVPKLGDAWQVGKLFRRQDVVKQRDEIIIALVPFVLPYDVPNMMRDCEGVTRSATPLTFGPLVPTPRPWEPRLRSADDRPLRLPPVIECGEGLFLGPPPLAMPP